MYRPFTIALLIILGLSSITLKKFVGMLHWSYPYLDEAGSILLISGVLSLLYKIFMDKRQRNELRKLFRIHESIERSGLSHILPTSNTYDFNGLIEDSKKLVLVMNDGYHWLGNYQVEIEKRFNKNGFTTEVFTIDHEGAYFEALRKKVDTTGEELKRKITQFRERIKSLYESSSRHGTLKIYSIKTFPPHSIFMFDHMAIMTLYQIGQKRMNVPLFEVKKLDNSNGIYQFLLEDVNNVRKEATCIFDSEDR